MIKLYVDTQCLINQLAMSWLSDTEYDIEIVIIGDADNYVLEHGITRLPALVKITETGQISIVNGFNANAYESIIKGE